MLHRQRSLVCASEAQRSQHDCVTDGEEDRLGMTPGSSGGDIVFVVDFLHKGTSLTVLLQRGWGSDFDEIHSLLLDSAGKPVLVCIGGGHCFAREQLLDGPHVHEMVFAGVAA